MESDEPDEDSPRESDNENFWSHGASFGAQPSPWWSSLGDDDDDDNDDAGDSYDEGILAATAPLPLPPEDRLWRHPSELRGLVSLDPVPPAPVERRPSLVAATVMAGLTGALIAGAAFWLIGPTRQTVTERVIERQLVEPSTAFVSASLNNVDVVAVAETVKPSMVRIEIRNRVGTIIGSGSGVIFRDDGHVLTNAHVIDGASGIDVVLSDGRRLEATAVGADSLTDVAVIRIDDDVTLPAILLGSTVGLRVGEPAIAIGSPLRLAGGPTVTVGVVSAIGRTLDLPDGGRLFDLVQTDAPISPGSSGGALVDGSGALIGITTVIAVSDVGAEGLGFATPVEIAYDVASDLLVDGEVRHGFLGVGGDDLAHDTAAELSVDGGATITAVGDGTPAADAGIEVGDIVIAVDGVSVISMGELVVRIRRVDPGMTSKLTVVRDGERLALTAIISNRPN